MHHKCMSSLDMYNPPLSSHEENLVLSHRRILHLPGVIYFLGLSGAIASFFVIWHFLTGGLFTLIGLLGSSIFFGCSLFDYFLNLYRKCDCGQTPLLTLRDRRFFAALEREERLGWKWQLRLNALIFAMLFCLIGMPALICKVAHLSFLWYIAYFSGTLVLLMALRFRQKRVRFALVAPEEITRIASLSGSTDDELKELVNFHTFIGNLDRADHYSQRLLSLAEERL